MSISVSGVVSNLDTESIITQLMSVESLPLSQLQTKVASFQTKLTAFGVVQSSVSTFQTALDKLSKPSLYQSMKGSIANSSVATVSANSSAKAGSYSLEVTQLAEAQKLAAAGQSSTSSTIGNGVITIDFGTISGGTLSNEGAYTGSTFTSNGTGAKTITIDSSNNSLAGIRDAINNADIGVTATIVNDGGSSPYRLVLTSNSTGASSAMKISVSNGSDGNSTALSNLLTFDPGGTQKMTQTMEAQDAELEVDGISVTSSSNTVEDAISGVTLDLLATNSGSTTKVTVDADTESITTAVNSFVSSYNSLVTTLKQYTAYDASTKTAAALMGDSTIRSIQTQLRNLLNTPVANNGSFSMLSQIGVTLQKDGSMAVDSSKLSSALENNFNDVAALFSATGSTTDSLASYTSATSKTLAGTYAVNVTQLATQGSTTASAAAGLTISEGVNDTLQVTLNGVSATIILAAGTYDSADDLAAEIQSKINGASAFSSAGATVTVQASSDGTLSMTSSTYGSASNISITGGNGQDNLGFGATATVTAGKNVAGTINGVAAIGNGQYLKGAVGDDSEGLLVEISGGAIGDRGTVTYSQGYACTLSDYAESLLDSESGIIAQRTDGLTSKINKLEDEESSMSARLALIEKRYRAQFTSLESALANMKTTSDYLTQQLDSLNSSDSSKS